MVDNHVDIASKPATKALKLDLFPTAFYTPNTWQHYLLYISAALLALLIALGCLAGCIALALLLPVTWPILVAMASLGAIFLAASMAFFKSLGQFATLKKALHYLTTGINVAVNSSYAVSGIFVLTMMGLGLTTPFWVVLIPLTFTALIGVGLGLYERKQKYAENQKLKKIAEDKQEQLDELQNKIARQRSLLLSKTTSEAVQSIIELNLKKWEKKQKKIAEKVIYEPAEEPKAPTKARKWFDGGIEHLNNFKNYLRNIRTLWKFLPLILIGCGVAAATAALPIIVVVAVFTGIIFASAKHYHDAWEDKVFTKNTEFSQQIYAHNLALALNNEKRLFQKQLQQIKENGEIHSIAKVSLPKQDKLRMMFANPMRKANYSSTAMYLISMLTSSETLVYASLSLAGVIFAVKFGVLTGGIAAPIAIGVSAVFAVLAVVSMVRRYNKETKQQQKQQELQEKYDALLDNLEGKLLEHRTLKLASELAFDTHNFRAPLGGFNYASYKWFSGLKKSGKGFTTIIDMLQAAQIPLTSIGITAGVTAFNPLLLGTGVVIGIPLAFASYKAEQIRVTRDKALDELQLVVEMMEIAVKQIDAAVEREKIVKHAQLAMQALAPTQTLATTPRPERQATLSANNTFQTQKNKQLTTVTPTKRPSRLASIQKISPTRAKGPVLFTPAPLPKHHHREVELPDISAANLFHLRNVPTHSVLAN